MHVIHMLYMFTVFKFLILKEVVTYQRGKESGGKDQEKSQTL